MISRELVVSAVLVGSFAAQCAFGDCIATTDVLVVTEIYHCQEVTFSADKFTEEDDFNQSIHSVGSSVDGTLVTGKVLKRSQIVTEGWSPGLENSYEFEVNQVATLFINTDADEYCSLLSLGTHRWYVTDPVCCDVLPVFGICLVPESIPIVKSAPKPDD